MSIRKPTSATLREQLSSPLELLSESASSPVADAFDQLLEAMHRTEASRDNGNPAASKDVSELGEYATELFKQALQAAEELDLPEVFTQLQATLVDTGRWVADHGGELLSLETLVDALARQANQTQDPGDLLVLYQVMSEIMDATAVVIRQDRDRVNPGRPWRILNMNRAIVATRTHQPDIMEQAFSRLGEQFPEDAPGFFSQGMEQMDLLDYPPHVREVMNQYYRKWSIDRSLH